MSEPTHREQCELEHNTAHLPEPVRAAIYAAAWEQGYAYGHNDVMGCYGDLADLALTAFGAGIAFERARIVESLNTRPVDGLKYARRIADRILKGTL